MRRYRILSIAIFMFVALVCTNMVYAQTTDTEDLSVQASVAASCRISSTTAIDFGAYDPTSASNTDAAGDMVLRCVKNTSYKTYITGTRSMTTGGDTLTFQLYSDSGRSSAYPSTAPGSGETATSNAPVTKDIYGRIAALQDVGVASYSTNLVATVEY
jgi:spore coat protein U-like protein